MFGLSVLASAGKWFISTTPGRILLGVVAFFIWLHFHDAKVADRAKQECQAEQLQKTLNEVERQRRASDAVIADAEKQQTVSDREMSALKTEKEKLDAELAKTRTSCRLIPDEQRRKLRNIK